MRLNTDEVSSNSVVMIVNSNMRVSELMCGCLEVATSRCRMTRRLKDYCRTRLERLLKMGRNSALAKEVVVWYNFGRMCIGDEYLMPRVSVLNRYNIAKTYLRLWNAYYKKGGWIWEE